MQRRTILILALALLLSLSSFPNAQQSSASSARGRQKRSASLLLINGKVFTADAGDTVAEAVAVEGNKIVAVGTTREIQSKFTATRTIDLAGKLVTPGFNDAHIHFVGGGLSLMRVDLNGAQTLAEAKRRVAERAKELPAGTWIRGRGWDHTLWGGAWPTREDLDEAAPNHPVFLQRVDGHVTWANTLALKRAGVTRDTKAPEGGEILQDARGEPTGILKETAAGLVSNVVPATTVEESREAVRRALAEARRYGITSVQDNSGYEATKIYREMMRDGKLTVRVSAWQDFEDTVEKLKAQRAEFAASKDDPLRLRLGALKGYVDGTLGSRTAAMLEPFADDPKNSGIPRRPPEELTRMIVERDVAEFQIALHAIGDRANRMALNGFEEADKLRLLHGMGVGRRSPLLKPWMRHRVEHAQVIAPSDFLRFAKMGVVASMQPSHAISDKRWAQDRLGEYRVLGAYAWHKMQAFGVRVAFGTDWPVEPVNPYLGLYAAVTRQSTEGDPSGGWWPQERLSIEDAIRCYTAGSAYASFEEKEKGQIAVGMLADMVVHSRDLLTIKPEDILKTEAVMTIFDGRVVYERGVEPQRGAMR